jgi:hypothetical protein
MKNTKKDIAKLKFVKLNGSNNLNKIKDEIHLNSAVDVSHDNQEDVSLSKPTYKKFDDVQKTKSEINATKIKQTISVENLKVKDINLDKSNPVNKLKEINFKLPKFLVGRENQKQQINSLKDSQNTNNFGGSLPFTKEDFGNNPNSFTTIFKKDNDKINGFQRVFRKSVLFLIMQQLSFFAISFVMITGIGLNFVSGISSAYSLTVVLGLIVIYASITSIFYIIVADRSYIWISLCLQSLILIAIYWILGLGLFSPITILLSFLIFILSYFAYLEVEKIQVSTRFFSIGYVTSEALKILSTVAIITICLGIFNVVTIQTPKTFISKNLINNDGIYNSVVLGNVFPFSIVNLNRLALAGDKYSINSNGIVESAGKIVDFRSFLIKNSKQSVLLTELEKAQINSACDTITEKECATKISTEQDNKLKTLIKAENSSYKSLSFGLDEVLDKNTFKDVLRAFYSDKVDDLNNQSATINEITYIRPFKQYIDPILPNIIQASVAVLAFVILSFFKFLMNIVTSILIWIIWKFMLVTGFAKIDVELVESEIVSI